MVPDPADLQGFLLVLAGAILSPSQLTKGHSELYNSRPAFFPDLRVGEIEGTQRLGINQPQGHYGEPCLPLRTKISFSLLIKVATE